MLQEHKKINRIICWIIIIISLFNIFVYADDSINTQVDKALRETVSSIESVLKSKGPSFGDEWLIMDLALYGADSVSIFSDYYESIENYLGKVIPTVNVDGVTNAVDKNKSTENSRLILALSAIGKYASSVNGYDLTEAFNNFNWIKKMGRMGPVWALISLNSFGYELKDSTIRQQCVEYILDAQLESGGWDLVKKNADVDVTAMTLQALYPYRNQNGVKSASDKAFAWLSSVQNENGGFCAYGEENSESAAQVIVACCTWGINPATDKRFIKNNKSVMDNILSFRVKDSVKGWGFAHTKANYNNMATEQAAYALIAYNRLINGQSGIYDMTLQKPFTDISDNIHQSDIEYCSNEGLMNGIGNNKFNPEGTFNRAMLITTLYRLAGSPKVSGLSSFSDVPKNSWYAAALKWAEDKGIAGGYGNGLFGPEDSITAEQIWVFLYRFSTLMGYDVNSSSDISCFSDNSKIDSWAVNAAKWAASKSIIKAEDGKLNAVKTSNRALSAMYLSRFDQNVK